MGRKLDASAIDEILEDIDPEYRDETQRILIGEQTTGIVGRCLTNGYDRYVMAAWDRELAHAVCIVRKYGPPILHVITLSVLF